MPTYRLTCERCRGTGHEPADFDEACEECWGDGYEVVTRVTAAHLDPSARALATARSIDPDQAPRVVTID